MRFILLIDRVRRRLARTYRMRIFLAELGLKPQDAPGCRILGDVTVNATDVHIGENLTAYPGVYLWGDGRIEIGNNCDLGKDTIVYASKGGGVTIGDDVIIAGHCYIIDSNHGTRKGELIRSQSMDVAPVVIGDDVWIGASAVILKGSIIHSGAIIGAGAVVNSEVPEGAIAVGAPARVIRYRD